MIHFLSSSNFFYQENRKYNLLTKERLSYNAFEQPHVEGSMTFIVHVFKNVCESLLGHKTWVPIRNLNYFKSALTLKSWWVKPANISQNHLKRKITDQKILKIEQSRHKIIYLLSLLNCVSCVLKTYSLAKVPCVLTCSRANVPCVFTCSRANVPCVLTCSRANVPCVLTCSRTNVLVLMPLFSVSLPLLLKLYTLLVRFKSLITVFPQ